MLTTELTTQLQILFKQYITAFKHYDLDDAASRYFLPCTLNTPDNVMLLSNEQQIKQALNKIFEQLKQAKTTEILVKNSSYTQLTAELVLVCIEWCFIDNEQRVFSDFSAFYHLIIVDGQWKIVNVTSHELENSQQLAKPFEL